ncbi:MAG TPA: hypothetical protein DIT07_07535 [Sphingobacteriaceae bacterium]|nr:hypothetical protein [Sphingobacteriaceae bacterium]
MNMATQELIETTVFCTYQQIDYSFYSSLEESGLIEITLVDEQKYIRHSQLQQLEKMARFYEPDG